MTQEEFEDSVVKIKRSSILMATSILQWNRGGYGPEDAFQEACMKAFKNLDSFRGESSFQSWFTRILIHCCLDRMRKDRRCTSISLDDLLKDQEGVEFTNPAVSIFPTQEQDLLREERKAYIDRAVRKLDPELRQAILLRMDNVSIAMIAETLGIIRETAKTRVDRARRALKYYLKNPRARPSIKSKPIEGTVPAPLAKTKGAGKP